MHDLKQIEAIVQDASAQGTISNIEALNIRLENQVCFIVECFDFDQVIIARS